MAHSVGLSQTARDDLTQLSLWIAESAGADTARDHVARIEKACMSLAHFPNRGTPRDDLGPGMRSTVFERRASIFYRVAEDEVVILHVVHAGRDSKGLSGVGEEI